MDVALAIEGIYPAAKYFGSTTDDTELCFAKLNWQDERIKPKWEDLQNKWNKIEPVLITKEIQSKLIEDKIREIAIDSLIADSKLPPDYKVTETKDAK